jgi:hypothetical protein
MGQNRRAAINQAKDPIKDERRKKMGQGLRMIQSRMNSRPNSVASLAPLREARLYSTSSYNFSKTVPNRATPFISPRKSWVRKTSRLMPSRAKPLTLGVKPVPKVPNLAHGQKKIGRWKHFLQDYTASGNNVPSLRQMGELCRLIRADS